MKKRLFKHSGLRRKVSEAFLTVFAVFMTLSPLVAVAIWTQQVFFNDSRKVTALEKLPEAESARVFEEPLLSVSFDDGWESLYTDAVPLLEKYDTRATMFVLPGEYDNPQYLSEDQVKSLQKAGHEIGSHSMTHPDLTKLGDNELTWQVDESKKQLESIDPEQKEINGFASPLGAENSRTLEVIRKQFTYHRDATNGFVNGADVNDLNTRDKFDRYNIIGITVLRTDSVEDIKKAIELAREHKAWLVLVYHEIEPDTSEYGLSKSQLEEQLKAIKDSGIKRVTIGETLEHMGDN